MLHRSLTGISRKRFFIAALVFVITATLSWLAQHYVTHSPGGDFLRAMRDARDLIAWRDPYRYPPDTHHIPYPLPAAFVGLPFSIFSPAVGAALFFGVSSALVAYGITNAGPQRLLVFAAMPYWFALIWAQWSPSIVSAAFFPILSPVVLIKPHTALPVVLTRL